VIVSFRDRQTARFNSGERVKAFAGFERAARLKLDRLNAAVALTDLSALPGNRFEALRGDRHGQYSIRINDQWRICFTWGKGEPGPSNVEIVDYHS
jgi:proteic killer suppression protein